VRVALAYRSAHDRWSSHWADEAALVASSSGPEGSCTLALVADGLLGQGFGYVPTSVVLSLAREHLRAASSQPPDLALAALLKAAHERLLEIPRAPRGGLVYGNMGAAVAAAWIARGRVAFALAGDGCVVRIRGGAQESLLEAHTLVNTLRRAQVPDWEEIERRYGHVLVRCLGFASAEVPWDLREEALEPGDRFVLGSRGLAAQLGRGESLGPDLEEGLAGLVARPLPEGPLESCAAALEYDGPDLPAGERWIGAYDADRVPRV